MLEYGNIVGKILWAVSEDSVGNLWIGLNFVEEETEFEIVFKESTIPFNNIVRHAKSWQEEKPYLFNSELEARREEKRILETRAGFLREKLLTTENQLGTVTQRIMELGGEIDG